MKTDIVNSSIRILHFSAELFGQNVIEISFNYGICRSHHLKIFKTPLRYKLREKMVTFTNFNSKRIASQRKQAVINGRAMLL